MTRITLVLTTIVLLLTSCTKVLYTHDQVMSRYKTKTDLSLKFGYPNQLRQIGSTEEWVYIFGTTTTGMATQLYGSNMAIGRSVTQTQEAKFLIDSTGNVIRWETNNLNYEQRVKDPKMTWAAVIGGVMAAALIIVAGAE